MADSSNVKRLLFPRGMQRAFISEVIDILRMTHSELATLLKISSRTLTDWKREKYHISFPAAKLVAKKTKLKIPASVKILPPFWSVEKAAKLGARATI